MDPFIAFLIQTLFGGAGQQGGLFSASQPGTINSFLNSLIAPAEQAQATPAPLQQGLPFYSDQYKPPPPPPAASPHDISLAALQGVVLNPDGSFMIIDPETGRRLSPLDFGQQQFDAQQAEQALQDDIRPAIQTSGSGGPSTVTVAEVLARGYPAGGTPPVEATPGSNSVINQGQLGPFQDIFDAQGKPLTSNFSPNASTTQIDAAIDAGFGDPKFHSGFQGPGFSEGFLSDIYGNSPVFFNQGTDLIQPIPEVTGPARRGRNQLGAFQTQNQSNAGFFFPNSPGFPGFF